MLQAPELSYIVRKMDEERPLEDATKATVCTHDKLMDAVQMDKKDYISWQLCDWFSL